MRQSSRDRTEPRGRKDRRGQAQGHCWGTGSPPQWHQAPFAGRCPLDRREEWDLLLLPEDVRSLQSPPELFLTQCLTKPPPEPRDTSLPWAWHCWRHWDVILGAKLCPNWSTAVPGYPKFKHCCPLSPGRATSPSPCPPQPLHPLPWVGNDPGSMVRRTASIEKGMRKERSRGEGRDAAAWDRDRNKQKFLTDINQACQSPAWLSSLQGTDPDGPMGHSAPARGDHGPIPTYIDVVGIDVIRVGIAQQRMELHAVPVVWEARGEGGIRR